MSETVVTIEEGKLRGKTDYDYHGGEFLSFLGIPYAKAPIGELRFKAPVPVDPWEDIKDATNDGPECPSLDMYFAYFVGKEDNCLHLNVFTKELPKDDSQKMKKPVMVWIYGGGFVYGSNTTQLYGPQYLMTQDVVLVAINYRIGIFGFLSLKDPSLEVPGNAGLKDLTLGLKWIQRNIERFGGDPNNVTIFGESAGSAATHYLTLSQATKGLFHKAIMQSGSALNNWAWGKNNAEYVRKYFGYKETDEKSILNNLKKEHAKKIVSCQFKHKDVFGAKDVRPWGPVVEPHSKDAFLTESPLDIIKAGRNHQIPVIIGFNTLEGMLYELVRKTQWTKLQKNLEYELPYELNLEIGSEDSKKVAGEIKELYFKDAEISEKTIEKVYQMKGDIGFLSGIQTAAKLQQQTSTEPIYMYRMTMDTSLNYFKKLALSKCFYFHTVCNFLTKLSGHYVPKAKSVWQTITSKLPGKKLDGVSHADDLFYLFKVFFVPDIVIGSKEDKDVQKFVKIWTNFARTGNPTPESDELLNNVTWKPIGNHKLEMLELGEELKMVGNEADEERMKFWEEVYKKYA